MLWELVSEAELRPIYPPSPKKQQGKKDDVKRWGNNKRIYYRPNSCHKSLTIHWGEVVHLLCSLRLEKKTLLGLVELIILMIYWLMPECSVAVELTSELSLDASPASADFFSFLAFFFSFFFLDFFSFFFLLFPEPSWKDVSFIMSFSFFFLLVSFCYKSNCSRR